LNIDNYNSQINSCSKLEYMIKLKIYEWG